MGRRKWAYRTQFMGIYVVSGCERCICLLNQRVSLNLVRVSEDIMYKKDTMYESPLPLTNAHNDRVDEDFAVINNKGEIAGRMAHPLQYKCIAMENCGSRLRPGGDSESRLK